MKTGMVFGVFDGLHEGHKHFLAEAKANCDSLIVVLTRDETAQALKNREPRYPYEERAATLLSFDGTLMIVQNDTEPGTWQVLTEYSPNVLILGYDQKGLKEALPPDHPPVVILCAYEPERYKSTLLNRL